RQAQKALSPAITLLLEVVNDKNETAGNRISAARSILEYGLKLTEFNDILPAIAAMDADVITIETSRSDMELLDAFVKFKYPNDIGPGVYDIHSPRVPSEEELTHLLEKALKVIPKERLWVNPDCGLKTRAWPETRAALELMVKVAKQLRQKYA
ncbi:MAG: hypothetical protein J6W29_08310, partial [Neisseriaceae bacterium]|nr:hypothetical protein [Neisseriaceae bacterium]